MNAVNIAAQFLGNGRIRGKGFKLGGRPAGGVAHVHVYIGNLVLSCVFVDREYKKVAAIGIKLYKSAMSKLMQCFLFYRAIFKYADN